MRRPNTTLVGSVLAGPRRAVWSTRQSPVGAQRSSDTPRRSNMGRKHGNPAAQCYRAYAVLGNFPEQCLVSLPPFPSYLDFWLYWEWWQPHCHLGQPLWAAVQPVSPSTAAAAQDPWPCISQGVNSTCLCRPLRPKIPSSLSLCLLLKVPRLDELVLVKLYKSFCYFSSVCVNTEISDAKGRKFFWLTSLVFGWIIES